MSLLTLICDICKTLESQQKGPSVLTPAPHAALKRTELNKGSEIKGRRFRAKATVENEDFTFCKFEDLYAKGVTFRNCSFEHCTFIRCYFRNCKFEACNMAGANFADCNLRGAQLTSCHIPYTSFRGTILEREEWAANLPIPENQRWHVARALRVNANSIGDAEAVNCFMGLCT
jgi:hypothetical protein